MGRPAKATNIHELTGAFAKNPKRKRARAQEPIPEGGLPDVPPDYMNHEQRRCYRELVRGCHRDVLSSADGPWVEIVACLLCQYREAPTEMSGPKIGRLMAGLAQLGMTPSDRARAARIPRKVENPFAKFAGGKESTGG